MAERQKTTGARAKPAAGTRRRVSTKAAKPAGQTEEQVAAQQAAVAEALATILKDIEDAKVAVAAAPAVVVAAPKEKSRGLLAPMLPYILLVAWAGWYFFIREQGVPAIPDVNPAVSVEQRAAAAIAVPDANDREVVSVAFETLSELLAEDATVGKPGITRREQVAEMIPAEAIRSLLLIGIKVSDKDAIATVVASYFDTEAEFPQKAGPLSAAERTLGVKAYRSLSAAFK